MKMQEVIWGMWIWDVLILCSRMQPVSIVIHQQGSTSLIQRKFAIGYNRAGRIMDQLEKAGIVGPAQGSKAREVFCIDESDLEMRLNNLQ